MCGRLELGGNIQIDPLLQQLNLPLLKVAHNIAPTETVPVIIKQNNYFELHPMRWWLIPAWVTEPSTKFSMFNARADRLSTSKAFKASFQRRRCLVPVTGFYEWKREGKLKTPYLITSPSAPMLLAGIWDVWEDEGTRIESFAIVTTDASPEISWLHNRQPVFIAEASIGSWMNSASPEIEVATLLLPHLPYPLEAIPISNKVGNSRYKNVDCIYPIGNPIPINHS